MSKVQTGREKQDSFSGPDPVLEKTREMTALFRETEDYRYYQNYLAKLLENQNIWQRLNELRRKNLNLSGQEENYTELSEELCREYDDILKEPFVMEFLTAEERINRMLRSIYDCIAQEIQIDISYMD